jgi:hypothetical protein
MDGIQTIVYIFRDNCGQSYNLHLNVVHFFSTRGLIRHLWQHMTVVFRHWCLMHAVLLQNGIVEITHKFEW